MPNKNSPICSTKIELKREFKQEHKENEYVIIKGSPASEFFKIYGS